VAAAAAWAGVTTDVTSSWPAWISPLSNSVYVPSVTPSRIRTAFSWLLT
jgi:hypothetical protein